MACDVSTKHEEGTEKCTVNVFWIATWLHFNYRIKNFFFTSVYILFLAYRKTIYLAGGKVNTTCRYFTYSYTLYAIGLLWRGLRAANIRIYASAWHVASCVITSLFRAPGFKIGDAAIGHGFCECIILFDISDKLPRTRFYNLRKSVQYLRNDNHCVGSNTRLRDDGGCYLN